MASVMAYPHRKPVPTAAHMQQSQLQPQYSQDRMQHSRTRTNSSSVMPYSVSPAYSMTTSSQHPSPQPNMYSMTASSQQQPNMYPDGTRRTMSNATSSTSSTSANRVSTYSAASAGGMPRRSTSSRSNSSIPPTSYVALMRKQKATVWCDRAQHEDPRILVAQRQAKMRAAADIAGGSQTYVAASRTSTSSGMVGGVRSKIRHHGAPKASAYNAAALGGAGVPVRLSATEVDEGDSDEESRYQTKTGSGRNSIGSGRRGNTYTSAGMNAGKNKAYSNGSTPSGVSPVDSIGELAEDETPVPTSDATGDDYFNRHGGNGGSGSSGEAEEKFGGLSGLPQSTVTAEQQVQQRKNNAEDLRRRGSVDERTSTMSGVRLFIANPDFSD